ncbi:PREDICTED: rho guanine nucleotide exchange factor 7 isoform X2 [Cyphomyrmex costatus]|uniref:rho guanine nucleotide exchange factor 7 isoform X2 n=1 Tax=Cyphomyrmex costatus TaxID=456900 RepID=UPI0008522F3F|nr:PREDICTED: rho guanine nucleotide exchange factor 7 isoform X2 [Cyphomyrmex costatus]
MSKPDAPKYVTALFSFKGKNNDELCFKKGDVITITQADDESWWEGTLHDKTGWFPSNYVKEYRAPDGNHVSIKTSPERSPQESPAHQKLNRDIVLKDIVDSERVNVAELQGLVNNFLQPLETSNIDELNEFMERSGAISPGILVLTTGLSKPFRRLDKYSAMLQELERYTEKNHPDRGDTQRSITVYREIADHCASIRKQRELALQILTSGVKGWEGEELNSLGEIIHVGSVSLATGVDRRDRYFVLFPTTLLVLSTSPRMSSFIYEGKLPLTGINVTGIEDTDEIRNALEITGPMIESIVVLCATKEERQRWIDLLIQEQCTSLLKSPTTPRQTNNQPNGKHQRPAMEHCTSPGIKTPWSIASLRPAPPLYSLKNFGKLDTTTDTSRSPRSCNERQFEEDAIILKVIEGYCLSVNARFTVHSGESNSVLDYESQKSRDRISLMHNRGNWESCNDRTLSETVKTLKNQMTDLQSQMSLLTKQLDEERRSRLSLAATVKRSMGVIDG